MYIYSWDDYKTVFSDWKGNTNPINRKGKSLNNNKNGICDTTFTIRKGGGSIRITYTAKKQCHTPFNDINSINPLLSSRMY